MLSACACACVPVVAPVVAMAMRNYDVDADTAFVVITIAVEFVDDSLHELYNITKGNNVPKTCSALCDELANATSPTHANFTRSTCGTLCTGFTYPGNGNR